MFKKTVVICLALLFVYSYCLAAEKSAMEIVKGIDKILSIEDVESEQLMTVFRKDGTVRPYRMKVMTSGKEKSFAEILAPPREAGRQTLKLGDTVWSYLPSVKKSIRVSGRGSFMGGDFENNDVLRLDLVGDYTAEIIQVLPDQYVLGLKGKDLSLSYAKIKLWVKKGDYQPVKQEYYTLTDKLIKSTLYQNIRDYGGHKRPAKLVMQSALHPRQKTELEMVTFKRKKTPAKRFRRSNLGK